jgi:hypothetical protein
MNECKSSFNEISQIMVGVLTTVVSLHIWIDTTLHFGDHAANIIAHTEAMVNIILGLLLGLLNANGSFLDTFLRGHNLALSFLLVSFNLADFCLHFIAHESQLVLEHISILSVLSYLVCEVLLDTGHLGLSVSSIGLH